MELLPGTPTIAQLPPTAFAAEQYRRVAVRLEELSARQGPGGCIIAITSPEPSDGKSLTALNLAITLTQSSRRRRLLLVDGDPWKPSLGGYLGDHESGAGFLQAVADPSVLPDCITTLKTSAGAPALDLLLSEERGRPELLTDGSGLAELFARMRASYDMVLVDTPPVFLASGQLLLSQVDGALVVVRADETKRAGIEKTLAAIGRDMVLGLILNDIDAVGDGRYGEYDLAAAAPRGFFRSRGIRDVVIAAAALALGGLLTVMILGL